MRWVPPALAGVSDTHHGRLYATNHELLVFRARFARDNVNEREHAARISPRRGEMFIARVTKALRLRSQERSDSRAVRDLVVFRSWEWSRR